MLDVICLGELLIDFVSTAEDTSLMDSPGFVKAPGGAPANVAVGVAKLGRSVGFIGKVGDDPFGHFLRKVLEDEGVDAAGLKLAPDARTTLAFVGVRSDGAKDIAFYRNPGADMMLDPSDIDESHVGQAKVFHFGSISLSHEPCKSATLSALDIAKRGGALISYDPNLRLGLWESAEQAYEEIWRGLRYADVAKVADEEWEFVTETADLDDGAARILESGPKLVIVSRGENGCYFNNGRVSGSVEAYQVNVAETVGAGDGFVAAILVQLLEHMEEGRQLADLAAADLMPMLRYANAVGALTCTKVGAIPALPTREEADSFFQKASV